jgi:hypothetical protein
MDYQYLKDGDGQINVTCLLTMQELKLLYNATIDMIKTAQEEKNTTLEDMYSAVEIELNEIIDYQQFKLRPNE